MFEALADAIDGLDLPVDASALTAVVALRDRLDAKVTMAAAEFDAAELWDLDGSVSMTAWLRSNAAMSNRDAARVCGTGRRLRGCPATTAAWANGRLSSGQVGAIVANVSDRTAELFAEHEQALVDLLAPLDQRDTVTAMRSWAAKAEAIVGRDEPPEPLGSVHLSRTLEGRGRLDGNLDPEAHDLLRAALRLAESRDVDGEPVRNAAQRRHDALADLARHYLDHQQVKLGGRHRPHLNVVVDLADLASGDGGRTLDGGPLDGATLRRIACDAAIHRVITDGRSTILDYGRATRTIPPATYTSLVLRDLGCRFPGCDRPPEWCEGHHVVHWEDGGPTDLDNLVLLCSRHHHRCHLPGWELKLLPNAEVEVTDPHGIIRTSVPPLRC